LVFSTAGRKRSPFRTAPYSAAIAGRFAGALHAASAIPQDWLASRCGGTGCPQEPLRCTAGPRL